MECSNQLGFASLIGTPHENILTIALINIHYLYNILSELPTPMWHDVNVQPCLTCGTFANGIVEIDLWMSSGESESLLLKVKSYQLPNA